jgi:hypothetical protein
VGPDEVEKARMAIGEPCRSGLLVAVMGVVLGAAIVVTSVVAAFVAFRDLAPRLERVGVGGTVLADSRNRFTALREVTYGLELEVTEPGQSPSRFRVTGTADGSSPVAAGTVVVSNEESSDRRVRFYRQGGQLLLQGDDTDLPQVWRVVDPLDAIRAGVDGRSGPLALALQRPTSFADLLLSVDVVEVVGAERLVTGRMTTRYHAHVSVDALLTNLGSPQDGEAFRLFTQDNGGNDLDLDAWVDDDGDLRGLAIDGTLGSRSYSLRLDLDHSGDSMLMVTPTTATPLDVRDLDDFLAPADATQTSP